MRVLVVEDEPEVRHLVDRILTGHGHHVVAAPNVFEAMALLLEYPEPIDVALLYLSLPGMGGYAYADHVQGQFPRARVIFMTGRIEESILVEAERRAPLLLKPFAVDTLTRTIETAATNLDSPTAQT